MKVIVSTKAPPRPACSDQDRRNYRHLTLIIIMIAIMLLIMFHDHNSDCGHSRTHNRNQMNCFSADRRFLLPDCGQLIQSGNCVNIGIPRVNDRGIHQMVVPLPCIRSVSHSVTHSLRQCCQTRSPRATCGRLRVACQSPLNYFLYEMIYYGNFC